MAKKKTQTNGKPLDEVWSYPLMFETPRPEPAADELLDFDVHIEGARILGVPRWWWTTAILLAILGVLIAMLCVQSAKADEVVAHRGVAVRVGAGPRVVYGWPWPVVRGYYGGVRLPAVWGLPPKHRGHHKH